MEASQQDLFEPIKSASGSESTALPQEGPRHKKAHLVPKDSADQGTPAIPGSGSLLYWLRLYPKKEEAA
ncbi:hypothetical protein NDU88_000111 [Pleurodeles waltl]|uniref:Uncharacterized protein n=1 Tax=Pleurodeles waltl TaxID=8319 RepID=A0AAV7VWF9_PLEWA|nr:hypothetical protein NDU88_000111 [Pleurodeles waltl]